MFEKKLLTTLPVYGKLFIGFFVCLMLCVTIWAAWLYTIEKGEVDSNNLPAYMNNEATGTKSETKITNQNMDKTQLRKNLGLAHTHINGQTLLYFALGLIFILTTAKPIVKTIVIIVFASSIFMHTIGLSGESFHWFFDDMLAFSGFVMLLAIAYMSFIIFIDLFKGNVNNS